MNKLFYYMRSRPLLALFLTSVVTICCVNAAISYHSKQFRSQGEVSETDSWLLDNNDSRVSEEQETDVTDSSLDTAVSNTSVSQDDSLETLFSHGDQESADLEISDETASDPFDFGTSFSEAAADDSVQESNEASETLSASEDSSESSEWILVALDPESLSEDQKVGLQEDNASVEESVDTEFFSEISNIDSQETAAAEEKPNSEFFFNDGETGIVASKEVELSEPEQTQNTIPADASSENEDHNELTDMTASSQDWDLSERNGGMNEESEKDSASVYAAQEPDTRVADYFGEAEELKEENLQKPAELTWTVPGDVISGVPAKESASGDEKEELTQDEFFEVAESVLDGNVSTEGIPVQNAAIENQISPETETAVVEVVEVSNSESQKAEHSSADVSVSETSSAVAAAEPASETAEPAAEESNAVTTDTEPAAENSVAAGANTESQNAEQIIADESIAAGAGVQAIPDYTSVSKLCPSEIWAVSTEHLNKITADSGILACWKAENGKFRQASLDEYKEKSVPEMPTIILIHGNMTDWAGALQHAQTLKYRIDQLRDRQKIQLPYRLVIWKWASERQNQLIRPDSQLKAYLADLNGFYLASFLNETASQNSDITLIGFSFGARTIGSAFELMSGGAMLGHTLPANDQVRGDRYHAVLLAGACNYGDFGCGGQYVHGSALLTSMINVFNPIDKALHFYPLLYGAGGPSAIGVAPIDPSTINAPVRQRLWSIDSSIYGPQHNFANLIYSISDSLLKSLIFAEAGADAAENVPTVSKALADPTYHPYVAAAEQNAK